MDSTAPSCFLRVSCLAMHRRGVPPKRLISLPARQVWDVPLGTLVPGQKTGSINLGGPMITAGGLVFTAAAMDLYLRAFDIETGKELWQYLLPAGGQATPMTYTLHGKQYVRHRSRRARETGHQTGRLCDCVRAAVAKPGFCDGFTITTAVMLINPIAIR